MEQGYGYDQGMQGARATQVVMTQPMSTMPRDWDQGLCGCFSDAKECCCVLLNPCYVCTRVTDFHEHCCNAWPCFSAPTFLALRYNMRQKENISGSLMNDHMTMMCCGPCAICQLFHEQKHVAERAVSLQPVGGVVTITTVTNY